MLHDPDLGVRARRLLRRQPRELGANGVALLMLAGVAFGLILIELLGRLTGHPGVALLLGLAR